MGTQGFLCPLGPLLGRPAAAPGRVQLSMSFPWEEPPPVSSSSPPSLHARGSGNATQKGFRDEATNNLSGSGSSSRGGNEFFGTPAKVGNHFSWGEAVRGAAGASNSWPEERTMSTPKPATSSWDLSGSPLILAGADGEAHETRPVDSLAAELEYLESGAGVLRDQELIRSKPDRAGSSAKASLGKPTNDAAQRWETAATLPAAGATATTPPRVASSPKGEAARSSSSSTPPDPFFPPGAAQQQSQRSINSSSSSNHPTSPCTTRQEHQQQSQSSHHPATSERRSYNDDAVAESFGCGDEEDDNSVAAPPPWKPLIPGGLPRQPARVSNADRPIQGLGGGGGGSDGRQWSASFNFTGGGGGAPPSGGKGGYHPGPGGAASSTPTMQRRPSSTSSSGGVNFPPPRPSAKRRPSWSASSSGLSSNYSGLRSSRDDVSDTRSVGAASSMSSLFGGSSGKPGGPLHKLREMGFEDSVARNALAAAGGNVDLAIRLAIENAGATNAIEEPAFGWAWEAEKEKFLPFDPTVEEQLRKALARGLQFVTLSFAGNRYEMDLDRMTQTNLKTGGTRRIRPPPEVM